MIGERHTFTHKLLSNARGAVTLEPVRFRPHHLVQEPIEPFSGLDDNDTLPAVASCDRCVVRIPRQDVLDGVTVECTKHPKKGNS